MLSLASVIFYFLALLIPAVVSAMPARTVTEPVWIAESWWMHNRRCLWGALYVAERGMPPWVLLPARLTVPVIRPTVWVMWSGAPVESTEVDVLHTYRGDKAPKIEWHTHRGDKAPKIEWHTHSESAGINAPWNPMTGQKSVYLSGVGYRTLSGTGTVRLHGCTWPIDDLPSGIHAVWGQLASLSPAHGKRSVAPVQDWYGQSWYKSCNR